LEGTCPTGKKGLIEPYIKFLKKAIIYSHPALERKGIKIHLTVDVSGEGL
jgi:hypothetical protein